MHLLRLQVLAPKQNTSQWIQEVIQIFDTKNSYLINLIKGWGVALSHFIALHAEYYNSFSNASPVICVICVVYNIPNVEFLISNLLFDNDKSTSFIAIGWEKI